MLSCFKLGVAHQSDKHSAERHKIQIIMRQSVLRTKKWDKIVTSFLILGVITLL